MFGSFIAVIAAGTAAVGGSGTVFDRNYRSGRIQLFNLDPDPRQRHTVWSVGVGQFFVILYLFGINQVSIIIINITIIIIIIFIITIILILITIVHQVQVQRYMAVGDRRTATRSVWLGGLLWGAIILTCGYGGLVAYAFYYNCDPLAARQIQTKDQIFPIFVMQVIIDNGRLSVYTQRPGPPDFT